ncbi:MAG TPA: hypothetical protein VF070_32030 [Streptosporangiaceae bacterium]
MTTASAATGAAAGAADAEEGIPLILVPEGIAVGSDDGDPDVPAKPGSSCPLAGVMAAPAEAPLLPQAVSRTVLAAAAPVATAHQRRFQRR